MNVRGPDWTPLSWQQLLAAYTDGELDAVTRRRFREWLADHPEVYDRLEMQSEMSMRNADFWDMVRPPAPDRQTWEQVWNRVQASLDTPAPSPPRSRWQRRGMLAVILALPSTVAAALVVMVALSQLAPRPELPQESGESPLGAVFAVAGHGDVEILSIRDDDVQHLVVGKSPFPFEMTFVISGDVRVDGLAPADDGMMPDVHVGWHETPMVFAALSRNP